MHTEDTSAFTAEFLIMNDWSSHEICGHTREIFIDLIETERQSFGIQKKTPTMQDVLTSIYTESQNRIRRNYKITENDPLTPKQQLKVFDEYLKCISTEDLLRQHKLVYLTDYADKKDTNFAKEVFDFYTQNLDTYSSIPQKINNYLNTYCQKEKYAFEKQHNISSPSM